MLVWFIVTVYIRLARVTVEVKEAVVGGRETRTRKEGDGGEGGRESGAGLPPVLWCFPPRPQQMSGARKGDGCRQE